MPKKPKHKGRCKVRYDSDGEIDEVLVYDGWGRCLVHIENMGNWFFMGVGSRSKNGAAAFGFDTSGKFNKEPAVMCSFAWCDAKIKGHKPKEI